MMKAILIFTGLIVGVCMNAVQAQQKITQRQVIHNYVISEVLDEWSRSKGDIKVHGHYASNRWEGDNKCIIKRGKAFALSTDAASRDCVDLQFTGELEITYENGKVSVEKNSDSYVEIEIRECSLKGLPEETQRTIQKQVEQIKEISNKYFNGSYQWPIDFQFDSSLKKSIKKGDFDPFELMKTCKKQEKEMIGVVREALKKRGLLNK
ncbi:hypothetical protein [Bacteroides sp. 224]|uniref:hypothetical protein n=1 Tax=Bacteroides sp. 224 TaxID=2302936 RepID=UPI0013D335D4|nr:hypothetical protein [Bacteroides sp. 224]NDV66588.1 hypothetical protein [Bacteroides sp. 224]